MTNGKLGDFFPTAALTEAFFERLVAKNRRASSATVASPLPMRARVKWTRSVGATVTPRVKGGGDGVVANGSRGGGGGSGDGEAIATVGVDSTVTPSAVEAASAVPIVEESKPCTAAAVLEAGTAMVAVMITLAAATLILTSLLSTPAAAATLCCKLEVSE